jgi:hypothetical protein
MGYHINFLDLLEVIEWESFFRLVKC